MKRTLWITVIVLGICALGVASKKVTTTLNLETGFENQQYSAFGIVYREFTNIQNPMICPNWKKPTSEQGKSELTKSCFIHFLNTQTCTRQIIQYQAVYEQGCST